MHMDLSTFVQDDMLRRIDHVACLEWLLYFGHESVCDLENACEQPIRSVDNGYGGFCRTSLWPFAAKSLALTRSSRWPMTWFTFWRLSSRMTTTRRSTYTPTELKAAGGPGIARFLLLLPLLLLLCSPPFEFEVVVLVWEATRKLGGANDWDGLPSTVEVGV